MPQNKLKTLNKHESANEPFLRYLQYNLTLITYNLTP